jgi:SAM-dependent methyltransferase
MTTLGGAAQLFFALLDRNKRAAMRRAVQAEQGQPKYLCPCCGFSGQFKSFGVDNRPSAQCPSCGALERHRLLQLVIAQGFLNFNGSRILHFAPEDSMTRQIQKCSDVVYETADLVPGRAMKVLDIERIDLPDDQYNFVLCSHVLEHVDDRKALLELFRVLKPKGQLVALVPIIEGWTKTYEDSSKTTEKERELYFGQADHIRIYGADFRDRIKAAGFSLQEFTAEGLESTKYGLLRGDKIFVATKPPSA